MAAPSTKVNDGPAQDPACRPTRPPPTPPPGGAFHTRDLSWRPPMGMSLSARRKYWPKNGTAKQIGMRNDGSR